MKNWNYILKIDHVDGNWRYSDGAPVVLRTETYKSRTLEGIRRQYEKHNYIGCTEELNCNYTINGKGFYYDKFRGIVFED